MTRCTLELGGDLIAVANEGTFEAEYALFDPGEIELSAAGPGTIREVGYRTTAGEARSRLTQAGVTAAHAQAAAKATNRWIARAYARGPAVRHIALRLEAAELFDGRTYDAATERYQGAWLDLPALAESVSGTFDAFKCSVLMQAIHLAALLSESGDDEPLVLATAELTAQRKPGERTFKRITFSEPNALVAAFGALRRTREHAAAEAGPGRREIVAWLRQRAKRAPGVAARYSAIEGELGAREPPARGPLADPELWGLEMTLALGETEGVIDRLEMIERRRGRLPGTTYLRDRVALMVGSEEARAIAERVSSLSTSMAAFHELQLLAAQAWAAAGDVRQAHAFARDLLDDAAASDALRMHAREVLDATGHATTAPEGGVPLIPKPPLAPSGTDPQAIRHEAQRVSVPAGTRSQEFARSGTEPARPLVVDLSVPSYRTEPRGQRLWSLPPEGDRSTESETLEMLSLPPGMTDEPPPHDEAPRTPPTARITCTYLARELGRELRIRHGVEVRSDLDGLEVTQRYLLESIAGDMARTPEEDREVMRHGAFVCELLARRLGARWADLDSADPVRWAMLVPSRSHPDSVCRVWPFARVLRFVAMRHRERDLVSYLLQLEVHAN